MFRNVQITEGTPDQLMVPICCDTFEVMLASGVLTQARGIVYMRAAATSSALARIGFCPFCGAAVDEHEVELLDENEVENKGDDEGDDVLPYEGMHTVELNKKQRWYRKKLANKGVPAGTSSMMAKAASAAQLKGTILPKMPKGRKLCSNCNRPGHTRPTCTEV